MSLEKFEEELKLYILAGQPGFWIQSDDELRTQESLVRVLKALKDWERPRDYDLITWSRAAGLVKINLLQPSQGTPIDKTQDPMGMVRELTKLSDPDKSGKPFVVLLFDFHMIGYDRESMINRSIKDLIVTCKRNSCHVMLVSGRQAIPPEWEKMIVLLEQKLPTREELRTQLIDFTTSSLLQPSTIMPAAKELGWEPQELESGRPDHLKVGLKVPDHGPVILEYDLKKAEFVFETVEDVDKIRPQLREAMVAQLLPEQVIEDVADAGAGLTPEEFETFVSVSFIQEGKKTINARQVMEMKAAAYRKNALLDMLDTPDGFEAVGGCNMVKEYFEDQKGIFTQKARDYGLPNPKGILLVGIPGGGKSLISKVAAVALGIPCLKMDMGRFYGSLVGQSEENARRATAAAEAMAPCLLFMDEIEKMFGGGSDTSGVSQRLLGHMLGWMNDRTAPVFIIASANKVADLPPELLREGRWDEIFAVKFPVEQERAEILKIHLSKSPRNRNPEDFDIEKLVAATANRTGAEIERGIIRAMTRAFSDGREFDTADIDRSIRQSVPMAETMKEKIAEIEEWCKNRARPATDLTKKAEDRARTIG